MIKDYENDFALRPSLLKKPAKRARNFADFWPPYPFAKKSFEKKSGFESFFAFR